MCSKELRWYNLVVTLVILGPGQLCWGQTNNLFPLTQNSLTPILRGLINAPAGRKPSLTDVYIRYYSGKNSTASDSYGLRDIRRLLDNPGFDHQKPTVLYAHGYVELVSDNSVITIVKAYQELGIYNLLVLDWSNLSYGNYVVTYLGMPSISKEVGRAMCSLVKAGLSHKTLHLVGFSLGSHILSGAAKYMASKHMKVPRLSGLDPALLGFYPLLKGLRINVDDADFVDIIHTDSVFYGTPQATGHADFWPNGGTAKQPGCPTTGLFLTTEYMCSHERSWQFWAESVNGGQFKAKRCLDYDTFIRGYCEDGALVYMGLGADSTLRGNFYLHTAGKQPFALGERGAG